MRAQDRRQEIVEALEGLPEDAFASHISAGRLYDVPLPTAADVHVSVRKAKQRRQRAGVVCHLNTKSRVRELGGVRVSAPLDTFMELSRVLGLVDLVIAGDHFVRHGDFTVEALLRRSRRSPRARRAAKLVRAGVDSPMETRARLLLVLSGLPEPEVNLVFRDELGDIVRQHDLAYRVARLLIDYDGRQHIERVENWERDLERREDAENEEWRMMVLTARDIYTSPGRTIDRVWRILRLRGMRLPEAPSIEWQAHFPDRGSAAA